MKRKNFTFQRGLRQSRQGELQYDGPEPRRQQEACIYLPMWPTGGSPFPRLHGEHR